jgi:hypothetical protein
LHSNPSRNITLSEHEASVEAAKRLSNRGSLLSHLPRVVVMVDIEDYGSCRATI